MNTDSRILQKRIWKLNFGFTLIELVMVITILGILAVVAVPRFPDMNIIRLDMASQKIQSDIRYAQSLAVDSQRWTRVVFSDAADNYTIYIGAFNDGASNPSAWTIALDPLTKTNFTFQLNTGDFAGIDLTQIVFNVANNQLVFDKWGNPYAYTGSGAPAVLTNPSQIRLLSSSGSKDVFVERGTGRVYIQ